MQSLLQGFALTVRKKKPPHAQVDDYVFSLPTTLKVASATSTREQVERPMTKGEMLGAQSKSVVSVTRMWEASRECRDFLWVATVKIDEQKKASFEDTYLCKHTSWCKYP